MNLLASDAAAGGIGIGITIMYIVVICGIMYFLAIRPQKKEQKRLRAMLAELAIGDSVVTTSGFYGVEKKEQKRLRAMLAELAIGDSVVTTSGFYGVVIDITDEDVIVEFGSNKNCRIPMKKTAISEVEKPDAE